MTDQAPINLQDVVDAQANLVQYFRDRPVGTHSRITPGLSPVPDVWTNWRDEQRAWRETAVIFDQSHHMPELFLSGPDALRLLTTVGVASLANLRPGIAKQFVACNSRGQMIGECILHDHGGKYELISGKPILNWVQYHAESGDYDVSIERDEATWENPDRRNFRFGMDGPNAWSIFESLVEGPTPEIKFFNTERVRIAGVDVLALRHGMAGHRGVELSGPYKEYDRVRQAILAAGADFGLVAGGAQSYYSTQVESGWISYPLPAIYTGPEEAEYRKWLPADSWEARFQLGGSFIPDNVEDLYVTPYDFGLDRVVKFDHDFIGRQALEEIASAPPRRKVALEWNKEDLLKVWGSQIGEGPVYKSLEFPITDYSQIHRDAVHTSDGRLVGVSSHGGYSSNEKAVVSLGLIDAEYCEPGTELVVTWGEPSGGSGKNSVERHEQTSMRATVGPVPFARTVRELKRQTSGASAH